MDLVRDDFAYGGLGQTDGRLVGVGSVDAPAVWNKIDTAAEDVSGFVNPLRVNGGVKTLKMAPPCLFSGVTLVGVPKANSNNVVFADDLLDSVGYGGL